MSKPSDSKMLHVGTTGDYKPLTWRDPDTGTFTGLDVATAAAFAKTQGLSADFVLTTWADMLDDLVTGRFQMAVGGISRTSEREAAALLSDTIETTGKVAVVRRGEEHRYRTLDAIDRDGVRVIENRGGTNERFGLAKIHNAEIILVPDNHLPFEFLRAGNADVMFTDSLEAQYLEEEDAGLCAANADKPFTHVEKVFLFRKDEAALQQAFNQWLAQRRS